MVEKGRLVYMDMLKAFAIILVIIGHVIQQLQPDKFMNNDLFMFIYSFHMPLFMMISGFFSYNKLFSSKWDQSIKVIKDRFIQLIVPLFLWTTLIVAINYLWGNSVYREYITNLWFLRCLFLTFSLYVIVMKITYNNLYVTIVLCLIFSHIGSIFTTYNVSGLLPAFTIGLLLRKKIQYINMRISIIGLIFSMFIFLISFHFFNNICLENHSFNIYHNVLLREPYTLDMFTAQLVKLLTGIFGTMFTYFLFDIFFKTVNCCLCNRKVLNYIGMNTLGFYILQNIYLERFISSIISIPPMNNVYFNLTIVPFFTILIISLCYFSIKIISRNKYCSLLLLGR